MTSFRCFLAFSLVSFLLLSTVLPSISTNDEQDDEDLRFLEETEGKSVDIASLPHLSDSDDDQFPEDDEEDEDSGSEQDIGAHYSDPYKAPQIDDKDVVVITQGNFRDFIKNNKFVMVEFYVPWCAYCQSLAPEYATAATELKGEGVLLAKVDATQEDELAEEYDVESFPTIYFLVDGKHRLYPAVRNK